MALNLTRKNVIAEAKNLSETGRSGGEETKVALLEAMCRKNNAEGVKSVIFTWEGEKEGENMQYFVS